jgi:2-polyprenyl-6-hydroxyphenyl methylase/3-demethylubiquinone-9 3-methyltransferase
MIHESTLPETDPATLAYFENLAHRWWDEAGPFWPLHRLNALRTNYIVEQIGQHYTGDANSHLPLAGIRILDIGCGGGLLSEAMARLGAEVTGIDVVAKNIAISQIHAQWSNLAIAYKTMSVEQLAATGITFDVVLTMEVVEHVLHVPSFLNVCGQLVRPGGVMVIATINRTVMSWLMAIVGAEYVLRWLPRGTHRWRQFVQPHQIAAAIGADFSMQQCVGVRVNPWTRQFSLTRYLGVNYMMSVVRNSALTSTKSIQPSVD